MNKKNKLSYDDNNELKNEVLRRTAEFCLTGRIVAKKTHFDSTTLQASPFAAIYQSEDYSTLSSKLGMPGEFIDLYEALFMAGFYTIDDAEPEGIIGVQPFADKLFLEMLDALPVGKNLDNVASAFAAVVLEGLVHTPPAPFSCQTQALTDLLLRIAGMHRAELKNRVPAADWKAVRKAAIALTDVITLPSQKTLSRFAESIAWSPADAPEVMPSAFNALLFEVGVQAYLNAEQASISPREAQLREEVNQRIAAIQEQGQDVTPQEINEWPQVREILASQTAQRKRASSLASQEERASFAKWLHHKFIFILEN